MNGQRDLGDLRNWARAELGVEPGEDELHTVISTLAALGYLSGGNGAGSGPLDVSDLALGSPGRSPLATPPAPREPAEPIDLGEAGRSAFEQKTPRPSAPDYELGAAGTGLQDSHGSYPGAPDPLTPPPTFEAEPPRGQDLSVDLSQHLHIGADDVKEAVRQSRVMEAVAPPPADFAAQIGAQPGRPPETTPPGSRPIEIPARPPMQPPRAHESHPPPPRAPRQGSPLVLGILVAVLILAVIGTAYYFLVFAKESGAEGTRPGRGAQPAGTEDTEPSAPVKATLAAGESLSVSVAAPRAGKVDWVEASESEVDEGAIVAKYEGFAAVADKLTAAVESRDRYQARFDRATTGGNKAAMAEAEFDVNRKKRDIEDFRSELETFAVKAPRRGVVTAKIEAGATVEEGQELIAIEANGDPQAVFEVADPARYKPGARAEIASAADPSVTAVCTVAAVEGARVTVACADSPLAEGSDVALK
jgi:hypothetical protein